MALLDYLALDDVGAHAETSRAELATVERSLACRRRLDLAPCHVERRLSSSPASEAALRESTASVPIVDDDDDDDDANEDDSDKRPTLCSERYRRACRLAAKHCVGLRTLSWTGHGDYDGWRSVSVADDDRELDALNASAGEQPSGGAGAHSRCVACTVDARTALVTRIVQNSARTLELVQCPRQQSDSALMLLIATVCVNLRRLPAFSPEPATTFSEDGDTQAEDDDDGTRHREALQTETYLALATECCTRVDRVRLLLQYEGGDDHRPEATYAIARVMRRYIERNATHLRRIDLRQMHFIEPQLLFATERCGANLLELELSFRRSAAYAAPACCRRLAPAFATLARLTHLRLSLPPATRPGDDAGGGVGSDAGGGDRETRDTVQRDGGVVWRLPRLEWFECDVEPSEDDADPIVDLPSLAAPALRSFTSTHCSLHSVVSILVVAQRLVALVCDASRSRRIDDLRGRDGAPNAEFADDGGECGWWDSAVAASGRELRCLVVRGRPQENGALRDRGDRKLRAAHAPLAFPVERLERAISQWPQLRIASLQLRRIDSSVRQTQATTATPASAVSSSSSSAAAAAAAGKKTAEIAATAAAAAAAGTAAAAATTVAAAEINYAALLALIRGCPRLHTCNLADDDDEGHEPAARDEVRAAMAADVAGPGRDRTFVEVDSFGDWRAEAARVQLQELKFTEPAAKDTATLSETRQERRAPVVVVACRLAALRCNGFPRDGWRDLQCPRLATYTQEVSPPAYDLATLFRACPNLGFSAPLSNVLDVVCSHRHPGEPGLVRMSRLVVHHPCESHLSALLSWLPRLDLLRFDRGSPAVLAIVAAAALAGHLPALAVIDMRLNIGGPDPLPPLAWSETVAYDLTRACAASLVRVMVHSCYAKRLEGLRRRIAAGIPNCRTTWTVEK